jgi:ubiquinone biosynthesis protein COQ4
MKALDADPDDTEAAIRAIAAMSGGSQQRCFQRFKRSPAGADLLRSRPELFDKINDVAYLGNLPENTLGHAIWAFYTTEELSAAGLKTASEAARTEEAGDTDFDWFGRRNRDLHDVFHVVTGYGRDMRGEVACLAFTFAQTWNTGLGYLVFRALRGAGWRSELAVLTRQAFKRGRHSRWLIDQNWEALLEQPLDALRQQLGVGPAPAYEQVRSPGAPVLN